MNKENFKGFKVYPYHDSDEAYKAAALCRLEIEKVQETDSGGFLYKAAGRWWDQDGEVCGLGYVLD